MHTNTMTMFKTFAILVALTAALSSFAADVVAPASVQALLGTYCVDCHGAAKAKGHVRFDTLHALEPLHSCCRCTGSRCRSWHAWMKLAALHA
jgi:hypothetical protein